MPTNSLIWEEPQRMDDNAMLLRFRLSGSYIDPAKLADISLPADIPKTHAVIFSGKMPGWLAARLAQLALVEQRHPWVGFDTTRADEPSEQMANLPGLGSIVRMQYPPHQTPSSSPSSVAVATSARDGYVIQWFSIVSETNGRDAYLDPAHLEQIQLPEVDGERQGVVFVGRLPVWLYARLALLAHENYRWCAVYSLRTQGGRATVVWSTDPSIPIGACVPTQDKSEDLGVHVGPFDAQTATDGLRHHAVAIVGAAHSGKSVLSYGLSACCRTDARVWRFPANPDGEGDWCYETTASLRDANRRQTKQHWDLEFATHTANSVRDVRRQSDVLFVDLAGLCSPELRLILRECSHAVLLRRADGQGHDECEQFVAACREDGVELVADLRSQLDSDATAIDVDPATGRIGGVVAGLDRGNRSVVELCRPLYRALLDRLAAS